MVSFHNFDHSRKRGNDVFHKLNLKIMKINDKVNFLEPFFLTTRNKPPNTNIPYKYAD